jgi:hypothetical protein
MVGSHLANSTNNYGPLNSHNSFAFENFYGHIVKLKSGTHSYQNQLLMLNGSYLMMQHLLYSGNFTNDTFIGRLLEQIGVDVQEVVCK